MDNFSEKTKELQAAQERLHQQQTDERRHHDQMSMQDRSATAAENSVKIARWSFGLAALALVFSLTGWSIPVIFKWLMSFGK